MRAFLAGGWAEVLGAGRRAADLESAWPLDPAWAWEQHLPGLDRSALPVLLSPPAGTVERLEGLGFSPVLLPHTDLYSVKLILNMLTTGAHVLAGKVYGNRMVDLQISNTKLFARACRIVAHIAGVEQSRARRALVAAILNQDEPGSELLELGDEEFVRQALRRERVVPLAVLIADGRVSLARARQVLEERPVLRQALQALA